MLAALESQPPTDIHLSNLMLTGPSHFTRKQIWLEVSGAASQLRDNEGYYEQILGTKADMTSVFTEQVDEDLDRTYSGERTKESALRKLRNVLVAYSWRNPSIGYCQGMNFITSRFLSFGLSEEETFWLLAQVVETYLPLDYFSVMTGVQTDQKVFDCLLKQHLPKVALHLQHLGVTSHVYTTHWFLTIFAYTFPREVVLRIWDLFFVERSGVLLRVGLALMTLAKDVILKMRSGDAFAETMKQFAMNISDPEELIQTASLDKYRIKDKQLRELRETFRAQTMHEMDSRSPLKIPKRELLSMIARPCTEQDCKLKLRKTASFLVLRTDSMLVIDDYVTRVGTYNSVNTSRGSSTSFLHSPSRSDLLLGRKSHDCSHDEIRSARKSRTPFP